MTELHRHRALLLRLLLLKQRDPAQYEREQLGPLEMWLRSFLRRKS